MRRQTSRSYPLLTEASGAAHPEAFGPFRVLHQIGAGALGPVFRAYHPEDDRLVAIKLFKLDLPPELTHKLVAELQTIIDADLTHQGIAAPLATGISGVSVYLAQDFVASESLDAASRAHGPAPAAEAVRIATEVAAALDFAADASVLHGALHPRDILVSPDDARLTGLGIARALNKLGVTTSIRRPYTAPERQADRSWDRRADIFSLAAIVHEVIWGRRITALGAEAASSLTPVATADLDALKNVFSRALAEDPDERFESAAEFADELRLTLLSGRRQVHTVNRPESERRSREERRLVIDEEEMLLPLEADFADEPAVSYEPEIVIERDDEFESEAPEPALAPPPAAPVPPVVQQIAPLPVVLPPAASPRRTAIYDRPRAVAAPPVAASATAPADEHSTARLRAAAAPDREETPVAADSPVEPVVPPPAFAAFDEQVRSTVWPLALSLAIGLAVGFAAGYVTAGRASTQVSAEASTRTETEAPFTPAAPVQPPPSVPETEVRVGASPGAAVSDRELLPAPPPPVAEVRPAPAPPRRTTSPETKSSDVARRAPARPPAPARASAADSPSSSTSAMMVESKPTGASVHVDGRLVGTTPLKLMSVAAGDHAVTIEHDGYQRWTSSVRIVAGKPARVTASLER